MIKVRKHIILFIITELFLLSFVHANNSSYLDSLNCIKNSATDTTLLRIYNKLAKHYHNTNIDSCTKYNTLALKLLELINVNKQKIITYNMCGMLECKNGFFKEGLNFHFDALNIAEQIKDTFLIARLYNNIGVTYLQIHDNTNAEKYLRKALLYKDNKTVKLGPVYNNLGLISKNVGNLDDAYKFFTKAHESYILSNDSTGIATIMANMGIVLFSWGKTEQSMKKMRKALNLSRKLGDSLRVGTVLINIGINYMLIDNYLLAEKYFNQCLNIAKVIGDVELINSTYLAYTQLYKKNGDFNKSLEYYKLYHLSSDSLFNIKKQNQITELNIRYESIKKNEEIEILEKDNQINSERIKNKTQWIYVLYFFIFIVFGFGIIIIIIRKGQVLSNKLLVIKNIEIVDKQVIIEKNQNENNVLIIDKNIVSKLKYSHSNLSEQQKDNLYNLLVNALMHEKVYLQNDLTIDKLATHLNISRTYLSQIINERFNKSFSTLINEFRIIEARKDLLNNQNITIEAISQVVGFKSKSSFNTAFKKYTGITPSFFIKSKFQS